jgi:hypothetical protein
MMYEGTRFGRQEIDYRELLKKYMNFVGKEAEEGVTFVSRIRICQRGGFTEDETKELEVIEAELSP